ncbi:alpha/beta hydrolase [Flavobacterium sufflavum]|uniref:Alpha/beta hydrolase n=1 Tax=Flavobacterium sufflavum TaxID=1921138 RepID=A0A3S3SXD4_9FLAO|nr:alpha/beta hydrolase [Flavobacterium sufflavum]RVT77460.1 alpha/beta hydrolase [Flavobacterium sufflavum]
MSKIPVYFMPGLAANPLIFERIKLDDTLFEVHYLEWEIPRPKESLEDYARRMTLHIKNENPVLIGVSFGGIVVQEMAKHIAVRKLIIISSVKTNQEFPGRIRFARKTLVYKLIPMRLILHFGKLAQFVFGEKFSHRMKLYDTFLSVRDIGYLNWAVEKVVHWNRSVADERVIHIHGDRDWMFPIKNIEKCIVLKGGTHVMIFTKHRWFNANLADIILGE